MGTGVEKKRKSVEHRREEMAIYATGAETASLVDLKPIFSSKRAKATAAISNSVPV